MREKNSVTNICSSMKYLWGLHKQYNCSQFYDHALKFLISVGLKINVWDYIGFIICRPHPNSYMVLFISSAPTL